MGKPTAEELKQALAEAGRMREQGDDSHFVAKALLNLNYRFGYLERVYQTAERYLNAGLSPALHAELVKNIAEYKEAEERSRAGGGREPDWLG